MKKDSIAKELVAIARLLVSVIQWNGFGGRYRSSDERFLIELREETAWGGRRPSTIKIWYVWDLSKAKEEWTKPYSPAQWDAMELGQFPTFRDAKNKAEEALKRG